MQLLWKCPETVKSLLLNAVFKSFTKNDVFYALCCGFDNVSQKQLSDRWRVDVRITCPSLCSVPSPGDSVNLLKSNKQVIVSQSGHECCVLLMQSS